MAQRPSGSEEKKRIYRKASQRLAFRDATFKASIVTIASAVGVFLAGTPIPFLLWVLEFFVALGIFYSVSLREIREESQSLIDKLNE